MKGCFHKHLDRPLEVGAIYPVLLSQYCDPVTYQIKSFKNKSKLFIMKGERDLFWLKWGGSANLARWQGKCPQLKIKRGPILVSAPPGMPCKILHWAWHSACYLNPRPQGVWMAGHSQKQLLSNVQTAYPAMGLQNHLALHPYLCLKVPGLRGP